MRAETRWRRAGATIDTMQERLRISTRKKFEVVDLTGRVADVVARAAVREGICTVFVRHATAAIVINENADPGFRLDVVAALDKLFPEGVWEHDKVDDNGAAHLKAAFLGPSEAVPVRDGRLLLGTWQGIALVECDGPREREIVVDVRA
jgi:secondary thiamine-phosphate synthase enzyme